MRSLRFNQRLTNKLLVAFHQALDQREMDIAAAILRILEGIAQRAARRDPGWQKLADCIVAANERMWTVRSVQARNPTPNSSAPPGAI